MSRNVISNREYIGEVFTSPTTVTAFFNKSYSINPGLVDTFPWLGVIAQNYEQYKFHGLVFEFRSTSGDTTASTNLNLGTVVMAAEYNVNSAAYASKQIMENSQYAQSSKSSQSQVFQINCNPTEQIGQVKFVRTGATSLNDSLKFYDHANFQIATVGNPSNVNTPLGELWVTYVVEFFKPQIPNQIGGNTESVHVTRTGGLIGNTFGTATTTAFSSGNVSYSFPTTSSIKFTALTVGNQYMLYVGWLGASTALVGIAFTGTGVTGLNYFENGTVSQSTVGNLTTNTGASNCLIFRANAVDVTITCAGTVPLNSNIDIHLTVIDATVNA